MSVADLMAAMAAAGAPMDAIILAIRALEEKDAQIEARRAGDRERKRRQRAASRDEHETVTGQSRDTDGTVTDGTPSPAPLNENNLTPPTHTPVKDKLPRVSWACPHGVDPKHWADFLGNRKRKRLATSESAYQAVLDDLAKLSDEEWPPGRLVQLAAGKSWGSINYPSDGPRNAARNGTHGMAGNRGGGPQPARILAAGAGFLSGSSGGSPH